jgi:hypothetical protein
MSKGLQQIARQERTALAQALQAPVAAPFIQFIPPGGLSSWCHYDDLAVQNNLPRAATMQYWAKMGRQVGSAQPMVIRGDQFFYGIEDTFVAKAEAKAGAPAILPGDWKVAGTTTGRLSSRELLVDKALCEMEDKLYGDRKTWDPTPKEQRQLGAWDLHGRAPLAYREEERAAAVFDPFKGFAIESGFEDYACPHDGAPLQRMTTGDKPYPAWGK